jgi:hypothetical protein
MGISAWLAGNDFVRAEVKKLQKLEAGLRSFSLSL